MGPLLAFVVKRLLLLVPILLGASIVVFLLVHLAPGDEATVLLGPLATPQARDELNHHLGLDKPLPFQYGIWLWNTVHLDFGRSISKHQPVADLVREALKNTLILAGASSAFAVIVGFALGMVAAARQFTRTDRLAMGGAVFLAAVPSYWLGIILVVVFSIQLHLFPSGGMQNYIEDQGLPDLLWHLVLPVIAAGAVPAGIIARTVRSSLLEVARQDFVLALRASGLSEGTIMRRHVLRNALPPIINMIGLQVGYLLSGVIFVEVVFSWPGIGRLVFEGIGGRDLPVILGSVMVVSVTFVLINLAVDVLHIVIDPRLSTQSA
jgi:ABC-type dipeptide/oligopeptide/nickel transport system permease component